MAAESAPGVWRPPEREEVVAVAAAVAATEAAEAAEAGWMELARQSARAAAVRGGQGPVLVPPKLLRLREQPLCAARASSPWCESFHVVTGAETCISARHSAVPLVEKAVKGKAENADGMMMMRRRRRRRRRWSWERGLSGGAGRRPARAAAFFRGARWIHRRACAGVEAEVEVEVRVGLARC